MSTVRNKETLTIDCSGGTCILRSRKLENSYLGIFLFFIVLSILLPVLFAIFFKDIPELITAVVVMFLILAAMGWGIGLLLVRDCRYVTLDKNERVLTIACGIPLLSILRRPVVEELHNVSGFELLEKPTRSGKAWFVYMQRMAGKSERILGPVEDFEAASGHIDVLNKIIGQ